jgi:uncharacterized protein
VAALAHDELGERAVAVTGVSASLDGAELEDIRAFCAARGLAHYEVRTDELSDPRYVANSPERCFHCKDELYGRVLDVARGLGLEAVLDGTNADDVGGHRPGLRGGH